MPKYMLHANYTEEGIQGLMKDGGTGRRAAVDKLVESLGGSLEAIYFAFGEDDVVIIVDLPSHQAATALSLTAGASGMVQGRTTVLLTPEEVDEAAALSVDYRPPGA